MFIWKLWKRIDNRVDKLTDWLAELTFKNPKAGLPLSLGIFATVILVIGLIASALNVAINLDLSSGMGKTFSSIGETFGAWMPALLGFGIILFAFSVIMKHVNANIETKKTASKNEVEEDSGEKTNDTSS